MEQNTYYRAFYDSLNDKVKISKREGRAAWSNEFPSEADARKDIKSALSEAKKKFKIAKSAFDEFELSNNCHVDYHMEGDTHGIYEDYLYIQIRVNGYDFNFPIRGSGW